MTSFNNKSRRTSHVSNHLDDLQLRKLSTVLNWAVERLHSSPDIFKKDIDNIVTELKMALDDFEHCFIKSETLPSNVERPPNNVRRLLPNPLASTSSSWPVISDRGKLLTFKSAPAPAPSATSVDDDNKFVPESIAI